MTLQFELPAADVARLLRSPALQSRRRGRARSSQVNTVWHDTPHLFLAGRGLSLGHTLPGECWRLERLTPDGGAEWLPAGPAPLVAEAPTLAGLGHAFPAPLSPVAAFHGRLRTILLRGEDAATPLRGEDAATPLRGEDAATPLRGEDAATPLRGEDAATPLRGEDAATPLRGEDAATPLRGEDAATPLRGEDAATQICLLEGTLRGVAQDRPACRIILHGQPRATAALARALSETARLTVPRAGLAAQALAAALGQEPAPRHTGAPSIPTACSTAGALRLATAHLADVILHWAPLVPGGRSAEPVHQMRVAVRRLRSGLAVFRRVAQPEQGGPLWLDELAAQLKTIAARLGAARDWDVFLAETGRDVGRAFAHDRRMAGLLAAAARRRAAAYAALTTTLAGKAWQLLELELALLPTAQPWNDHATGARAERLAAPVEDFAPRALRRQLKALLAPGPSVADLPAEELHAIRKRAKRLRYAIEVFAPLYPEKPVRKYLARLERLQAVLGTVNDTAVAGGLLAQLGGGADRAFAAGVVQGFAAAGHAGAAGQVQRAWGKLCSAHPFWD